MVEKKGLAPEAADKIHAFVSIRGDAWSVYDQLLAIESIQQNARAMKALGRHEAAVHVAAARGAKA